MTSGVWCVVCVVRCALCVQVEWGATLQSVEMPSRAGEGGSGGGLVESVLLGRDELDDDPNGAYLGVVVGRVAGRIAHSTLRIGTHTTHTTHTTLHGHRGGVTPLTPHSRSGGSPPNSAFPLGEGGI